MSYNILDRFIKHLFSYVYSLFNIFHLNFFFYFLKLNSTNIVQFNFNIYFLVVLTYSLYLIINITTTKTINCSCNVPTKLDFDTSISSLSICITKLNIILNNYVIFRQSINFSFKGFVFINP